MSQILITRDLMFSSRLASQARQAAIELRVIGNLEKLQDIGAEHAIEAVLLDLETNGVAPAAVKEWADQRRQSEPLVLIAYAPHGQVDRLREARAAGFDQVLTRGQFHEQGGALMAAAHRCSTDTGERTEQEGGGQ